jgi:osmotically-inducible protein OsmY
MGYYDDDRTQRQQFEDWHRYGRERGFFDRAADEVRSWFGDEEAEQRRQMDQQSGRGYGDQRSMRAYRPEWQSREYAGPGPRGSQIEEYGRYDEPRMRGGSRRSLRRFDYNRRPYEQEYYRGGGYGGGWRPSDNFRRDYRSSMVDYERDYGGGREDRDYGDLMYGNSMGRMNRRYDNRDFESGMPYGYEEREGRWGGGHRDWFGRERGGMFNPSSSGFGGIGERGMFGEHRGRGPRNYQRADERIADEINQFLTMHPELDASDIDVVVNQGIVTLKGRVLSRWDKRLAEEISEDVYGVKEVHNELRVNNGMNETKPERQNTMLSR